MGWVQSGVGLGAFLLLKWALHRPFGTGLGRVHVYKQCVGMQLLLVDRDLGPARR